MLLQMLTWAITTSILLIVGTEPAQGKLILYVSKCAATVQIFVRFKLVPMHETYEISEVRSGSAGKLLDLGSKDR